MISLFPSDTEWPDEMSPQRLEEQGIQGEAGGLTLPHQSHSSRPAKATTWSRGLSFPFHRAWSVMRRGLATDRWS